MKIYISVDMEGIGGVLRPEQVQRGTTEYETVCYWLTDEINAVIKGAQVGGATEIWIKDAHARAANIIWNLVEVKALGAEKVRLIQGRTRPERFPGLDATFAGMFLVGYHAMAGTPNAVLDHTWDYDTHFYFNGVEVGEIAVDAALAGARGVPVALVSGDDKTAQEAQSLLGELKTGSVETTIVKESVTSQGAILYPQEAVRKRLEGSAERACERLRQQAFTPYVPELPLHFRMTCPGAMGSMQTRESEGSDVRAVIHAVLEQS